MARQIGSRVTHVERPPHGFSCQAASPGTSCKTAFRHQYSSGNTSIQSLTPATHIDCSQHDAARPFSSARNRSTTFRLFHQDCGAFLVSPISTVVIGVNLLFRSILLPHRHVFSDRASLVVSPIAEPVPPHHYEYHIHAQSSPPLLNLQCVCVQRGGAAQYPRLGECNPQARSRIRYQPCPGKR